MWYVLRLDIYITPFGRSLLEYPVLLRLVSWATLFFEVVWIWTLLVPWKNDWFRWANIAIYASFHVGIGLAMSIGLFPVICVIPWIALLPCRLWRCNHGVSIVRFPLWSELSFSGRFQRLVCSLLVLFSLLWNLGNIPHRSTRALKTEVVQQIGFTLGLEQHFQMFDKPPAFNPWFVYEAELVDGSLVDLLTGDDVTFDRPESVRENFPTFHWRKLHRNMVAEEFSFLRQSLADYWVRNWNESHGSEKQVVAMKLICNLEAIGPDYNEKNVNRVIWASVKTKQAPSGGLFDQLLKTQGDLPF